MDWEPDMEELDIEHLKYKSKIKKEYDEQFKAACKQINFIIMNKNKDCINKLKDYYRRAGKFPSLPYYECGSYIDKNENISVQQLSDYLSEKYSNNITFNSHKKFYLHNIGRFRPFEYRWHIQINPDLNKCD